MIATLPFTRLILRAVSRQVTPMVIRLISVPDHLELPEFHNVMRAILGWRGMAISAISRSRVQQLPAKASLAGKISLHLRHPGPVGMGDSSYRYSGRLGR